MLLRKRGSWSAEDWLIMKELKDFMNEQRKAILLVDDDQSVLRTFTRILEKNGFGVDNAETGKKGLEKLIEKKYAVALIDLRLPDILGTELLEKMSSADEMVKIVITSSPPIEHPWKSAEKGADVYLQKPISPETLLSTITKELERRTKPRE